MHSEYEDGGLCCYLHCLSVVPICPYTYGCPCPCPYIYGCRGLVSGQAETVLLSSTFVAARPRNYIDAAGRMLRACALHMPFARIYEMNMHGPLNEFPRSPYHPV